MIEDAQSYFRKEYDGSVRFGRMTEIWAEPLPTVVELPEKYQDINIVFKNLPDVPLLQQNA